MNKDSSRQDQGEDESEDAFNFVKVAWGDGFFLLSAALFLRPSAKSSSGSIKS